MGTRSNENDHWTLDLDTLGMGPTGDALTRALVTCRPPFAVCVQGKWGSGKTSLMRYAMAGLGGEALGLTLQTSKRPASELPGWLAESWKERQRGAPGRILEALKAQIDPSLHEHLSPDETRVLSVWFNPWQHQEASAPIVALLQELRAQMTFLLRAREGLQRLAQVSVEAGVKILGELIDAFVRGQVGVSPGVGRLVEGFAASAPADVAAQAQRVSMMFEEAVKRLLNVPGESEEEFRDADGREVQTRRLVVFIDDLDRCSEAQAVRLLEGVKLYLQTRYCVFVFGLDGAAIRRAVERTLDGATPESAQEYLEKLFQATLHVPVTRTLQPFIEDLSARAGLAPEAHPALAALLEPNPRKIKNFLNSLALAWATREPSGTVPDGERVVDYALVQYLRLYHPEVSRLLTYDPSHLAGLHRVLQEGAFQPFPNASPVELLFLRAFRHAGAQALPAGAEPRHDRVEAVVTELLARLDRHKSDRAFVLAWQKRYEDLTEADVVARLGPVLRVGAP
ncbi:MAG: hypothetical protein HY909_25050 [Deltaproteobacteria bacterium]|nr:hypothetical protein [Deltaproteobacteria bacterium]